MKSSTSKTGLSVHIQYNCLPAIDIISCFVWNFSQLLNFIQGVPKKPQTIETDLLLEFQWPSTKMNVKSAHS